MTIEKSLWSKGKDEMKKFYNIRLNKGTNFKTFFFGLLFAGVIVFIPALLTFQIVEIFWYNPNTMYIFLAIAWGLLMLANGLSNYFTVSMAKSMEKDMTDLQMIDENAILFYQTFNIGFGIFVLLILVFFGVSAV